MKCTFVRRGDCDTAGTMHFHHVVTQQRLRREWRSAQRAMGYANPALVGVTLTALLRDPRNLVPLCTHHHHQVHHVGLRLAPGDLPDGWNDFVADFGLEREADHQLRLMAS